MPSHGIECPRESPVQFLRICDTKIGHYSDAHYPGGVEGLDMTQSSCGWCNFLSDSIQVDDLADFGHRLAESLGNSHLDPAWRIYRLYVIQLQIPFGGEDNDCIRVSSPHINNIHVDSDRSSFSMCMFQR